MSKNTEQATNLSANVAAADFVIVESERKKRKSPSNDSLQATSIVSDDSNKRCKGSNDNSSFDKKTENATKATRSDSQSSDDDPYKNMDKLSPTISDDEADKEQVMQQANDNNDNEPPKVKNMLNEICTQIGEQNVLSISQPVPSPPPPPQVYEEVVIEKKPDIEAPPLSPQPTTEITIPRIIAIEKTSKNQLKIEEVQKKNFQKVSIAEFKPYLDNPVQL